MTGPAVLNRFTAYYGIITHFMNPCNPNAESNSLNPEKVRKNVRVFQHAYGSLREPSVSGPVIGASISATQEDVPMPRISAARRALAE